MNITTKMLSEIVLTHKDHAWDIQHTLEILSALGCRPPDYIGNSTMGEESRSLYWEHDGRQIECVVGKHMSIFYIEK